MATRRPEPAGFGNCGQCAYRQTGTVAICYDCAGRTMEALARHRCMVCDQVVAGQGARCGNPLCNREIDERGWQFIFAIAMKTGVLDSAIKSYKYDGKWGWAWIFGRVVAGYLSAHEDVFRDFDMIIPSPTYVGAGGRSTDHTAEVLRRAQQEDGSWPFRFDIMSKVTPTDRLAGVRRFYDRARLAETQIAAALQVDKPRAVAGKAVLVYDDVFTDGLTLREAAHNLRAAGADVVAGLALSRQPFRG
jgi:predicted amidophosphoribosyltransferase